MHAARQAGLGAAAIQEAFEIALLIGGTIAISHLRRAFASWMNSVILSHQRLLQVKKWEEGKSFHSRNPEISAFETM